MTLFDPEVPRARASDPETSHQAVTNPSSTRARVLALFQDGAELSDDQLCSLLPDLHPPSVKTARSWLTVAGTLVDTGQRVNSVRGRAMIVWKLA